MEEAFGRGGSVVKCSSIRKCVIYFCKEQATRFAIRRSSNGRTVIRYFCESHWRELKSKPWFEEISEADVPIAEVMVA